MENSNLIQEKTKLLFELFKSNKFTDAENLARSLTQEYREINLLGK